MFNIQSKDSALKWDGYQVQVSAYDKLKLIINFRPDKKLKRLLERGKHKIDHHFDLMLLMKSMHHNTVSLRKTMNEKYQHEIIDIDKEEEEVIPSYLDFLISNNIGSKNFMRNIKNTGVETNYENDPK